MRIDRQERARRAFDLPRVRSFYVDKGTMDRATFDRLFRDMSRIRDLDIPGFDWVLIDHMLSVRRDIPLEIHMEALNAGLNRRYRGIEDFVANLVELGIEPPRVLNRTIFHKVPEPGRFVGETLLELGLLGPLDLERSLGIRVMIAQATNVEVASGQIFRSISRLSLVDLVQALGVQTGTPFESLDASASAIIAASARSAG
jgi:hypothetical protein